MNAAISFIVSFFSAAVPALIGLFRWKSAHQSFRPFILLMVAGMLSELVVGIAKLKYNYFQITPPVYNLYFISEFLLYLILYKNYKMFSIRIFAMLLFLGFVFSILDFIFLEGGEAWSVLWKTIPLYSEVAMSFIIIIPAIALLSTQTFQQIPFLRNAKNFIAIGTILLKAYTILLFSFILLKMPMEQEIFSYTIFQLINPLCYLLFTWATICIPNNKRHSIS